MQPFYLVPAIFVLSVFSLQDSETSAVTFEQRLEYAGVAVSQEGWHIWGTSPIIEPKGDVHLFVARWPISAKFDPGWRTHSEVAHYVSDSPEGPFRFSDVALAGTGGDTWDHYGIHNPSIHKVGKKYVLLYIGNNGLKQHPANQRIGMVISDTPYGPWEKVGKDGMILAPSVDRSYYNYKAGNGVVNPAFLPVSRRAFLSVFQVERYARKPEMAFQNGTDDYRENRRTFPAIAQSYHKQ